MAGNAAFGVGDRVLDVADKAGRADPALELRPVAKGTSPLQIAGVGMADLVDQILATATVGDCLSVPVPQVLGGRISHLDRMGRTRVMAVFEAGEGGIEVVVATQDTLATRLKIAQGDIESNIAPQPTFLPMAALASGDIAAGGAAMIDRITPRQVRRQ